MKTVTFSKDYDHVLERDEDGRVIKFVAYRAGEPIENVPAEHLKGAQEAGAVKKAE